MARTHIWRLAALIAGASPALAQEERPRIELGYGISRVAAVPYEDDGWPSQPPAPEVVITLPFSDRFSLEARVAVANYAAPLPGISGYYSIEVKQRIGRGTRGAFYPFVTYGATGHYWSAYVSPPWGAALGGGVQQALGSRVALRADAQLLTVLWAPVGARVSAGILIALGDDRRGSKPASDRHGPAAR